MPSSILYPASSLFAAAVAVRNALYDNGILKSESPGVPVIAIGNLTTGGSGKTPCVEHTLNVLTAAGKSPAVVSRGYGRKSRGLVVVSDGHGRIVAAAEGGDEPVQLARRFPEAIIVDAERRIDAAREAVSRGARCIVADDAFQHRALSRTLDIVIGGEEFVRGNIRMIPAGNGREPIRSLKRARIVISTALEESRVERSVRKYSDAEVYHADITPVDLVNPRRGTTLALDSLRGIGIFLLTGIARPERVVASVVALGGTIAEHARFRDHHWFTPVELESAVKRAEAQGSMLVTTEKDWIRLATGRESSVVLDRVDVRILRVALRFRSNELQFNERIITACG